LAWLGGIAVSIGIVLLLALAISRGWIGQEARTLLAGAGSAALICAAVWLHRRHGRTEAAIAMVGAGTLGMFATLLVAGDSYHLIAPALALAGSLITGAIATALAIRWAGQAIGAIGLVGALLSPVLVGAPSDATTLATLAVATACASAVVVWREWGWLALAIPLLSAPQWIAWLAQGHSGLADIAVLTVFAALGLAGVVAVQLRSRAEDLRPAAAILLVLNACVAGTAGELALRVAATSTTAELWLAAFGLAHVLIGALRVRCSAPDAGGVLIAIGALLCDVAFGLAVSGIGLALGWAAVAVGCTWLIRRTPHHGFDETALAIGSAAHVGLLLARVVILLPPSGLFGGSGLAQLLSAATLAACCLACGRVTESAPWRGALDALALVAIAYLTTAALAGDALVVAWAGEAAALAQIHRRTRTRLTQVGTAAFLAAATVEALAVQAPPSSLLYGPPSAGAAAIALGAVAVAFVSIGRTERLAWFGAAITGLYLASVLIVSVFLDHGAQVMISSLWAAVGLAALIAGLRLRQRTIRSAGLALLLLTVAKVFLYDLSQLTSIYRVISFIVLGLLLLVGALAHQRTDPAT
jgi:uncharacterized membrane protein